MHQDFETKTIQLPAFFPDATYSSIHSLPMYLVEDKIPGVVVTALHFKLLELEAELDAFKGFRRFASLPRNMVILSDSGGFQVLSLIHANGFGKITDAGATFRHPDNPKRKILFTPELSQEVQSTIASDIRICLDIPLFGSEDYEDVSRYMELNTRWAERAKARFLSLTGASDSVFAASSPSVKSADDETLLSINRPLLIAVIQGGNYKDLRAESANQLVGLGFDGFGFGGWPLDEKGHLNTKILEAFRNSVPSDRLAYGMGIGNPDDIVLCHKIGLKLFDCVIPTRNARHGYLFTTKGYGETKGETYDVIRIRKGKYTTDKQPVDPCCNCPVCQKYSRAYLRFLFKQRNPIIFTLATLHNVWWYQNLMERLE